MTDRHDNDFDFSKDLEIGGVGFDSSTPGASAPTGWTERWERARTTDVPEMNQLAGWLADRIGRVPLMIAGALCSAVSALLVGAGTESLPGAHNVIRLGRRHDVARHPRHG